MVQFLLAQDFVLVRYTGGIYLAQYLILMLQFMAG